MSTENTNEEENTEVVTTTEVANVDVNLEGAAPDNLETQEVDVPVVLDLDDEVVTNYLKSKGREFENLDALFTKPEAVENPYAKVIEEADVKSFLDYRKETGRSLADYNKLQAGVNDIPLLELALGQARKDVGGNVSNDDLKEYIEAELNIDLSDLDELTTGEKLKLQKFTKEYKAELVAEHEKYKTPLPSTKVESVSEQEDMVTLEDGQKISKKVLEEHQQLRQTYLENTKAAVDSVAKTSLNIEFDNNGTKEVLTYDYEFDAEDKKSMFSLAEDVDQTVKKLFRTENGFDHESFAKAIYRLDPKNWEKEVSAIVNKARAEAIEDFTKTGNNVNYNQNSLQPRQGTKEGVTIVPLNKLFNR